jgi:hypothetical protein
MGKTILRLLGSRDFSHSVVRSSSSALNTRKDIAAMVVLEQRPGEPVH